MGIPNAVERFCRDNHELSGRSGTHLAYVSRPWLGAIHDSTVVKSVEQWRKSAPYQPFYVLLKESKKTVKARINALRSLDPASIVKTTAEQRQEELEGAEIVYGHDDDEDGDGDHPLDLESLLLEFNEDSKRKLEELAEQKAIFAGHEVPNMWYDDMLHGLTEDQLTDVLSTCTPLQRVKLLVVARSTPCSILPTVGAGGTGKTTVLLLLRAALLREKRPLICSTTNAAVNNVCRRAQADSTACEFLYVRVHPEHNEHARISGFRVPGVEYSSSTRLVLSQTPRRSNRQNIYGTEV